MQPPMPDALDAALNEFNTAMTAGEAAKVLKVHPATVYRLIKKGRLRTVALGSGDQRRTLVRIPRAAVVELLTNSHAVAHESLAPEAPAA